MQPPSHALFFFLSFLLPFTFSSSSPSSLFLLLFVRLSNPSLLPFPSFLPHHTSHSLLHGFATTCPPRQCWVRSRQRHLEKKTPRRFRTATASSPWAARYMSSTTPQLSSSGSIRWVPQPHHLHSVLSCQHCQLLLYICSRVKSLFPAVSSYCHSQYPAAWEGEGLVWIALVTVMGPSW